MFDLSHVLSLSDLGTHIQEADFPPWSNHLTLGIEGLWLANFKVCTPSTLIHPLPRNSPNRSKKQLKKGVIIVGCIDYCSYVMLMDEV